MSRSTQYVGHTDEASRFLSKCERLEKVGESLGMFEEHVCDLHAYKDEEGNVWEEFVQLEPWSSGPMIFLAICRKDADKVIGWLMDASMGFGREFDREKGMYYI